MAIMDEWHYISSESIYVRQRDDDTYLIKHFEDSSMQEVWHDHKHSGSGANNWVIDTPWGELDLEFCSSEEITDED